jgi:hypothetical protein
LKLNVLHYVSHVSSVSASILFLLQVFHPSGWCCRSRSSESAAPAGSAEGLQDQLLFQALCVAAELSSVEQGAAEGCPWLHSNGFLFLLFPCLLFAPLCRSPSVVLFCLYLQPVLNSIFSLLNEKAEQLSFIIKKQKPASQMHVCLCTVCLHDWKVVCPVCACRRASR